MTGLSVTVTPPFLFLTSSRRVCSQGAYMINNGTDQVILCMLTFRIYSDFWFSFNSFSKETLQISYLSKNTNRAQSETFQTKKKKHLLNAETSLLLLTGNFFSFQGFIFSHEDPVCRFSCFAVNKCNSSHTMRINDVADDEVMAPAVF